MKVRETLAAALLVGIVGLFSAGCASSTLIESRPAGATVTLDGEYDVGETPLRVRDMPWIGSSRDYQFVREGYYPKVIRLEASRSGRHVAACLCSFGLMWPLALFGEFPEEFVVELIREEPPPRAEFRREPVVNF